MNPKNKIVTLALGHGLNDLIAGYFLGSFSADNNDLLQVGLAISIYNILAFGGQYPVAILMEKINDTKKIIVCSYSLNAAAVAIFLFAPAIAIVLAGIASEFIMLPVEVTVLKTIKRLTSAYLQHRELPGSLQVVF